MPGRLFGRNAGGKPAEEKTLLVKVGAKSVKEATAFIQELFADSRGLSPDEAVRRDELIGAAQAGRPGADEELCRLVEEALARYGVEVPGVPADRVAYEIYKYVWGLDVLEEIYRDPTVDEVRVNSPEHVYIQRRGKNERVDVRLKDDEHVLKLAQRLIMHDRVSLTRTTPRVESVRLDGTRVTATVPPFSERPTFVLRKHDTFEMTEENLVRSGTLSREILELLKVLVAGRANILISGGTGTGKTSLLRFLVGYVDPRLRIITLETDSELRLSAHYPERDIVALQEQADLGLTMREAFRTVLRYTPDVIIVGEARGAGEAQEMLKACLRGHEGSMGTIHTDSVSGAVTGLAEMVIEEGKNLPLEIVRQQVARAFDVVVQMYGNNVRGVKKVEAVSEILVEAEQVRVRDLFLWEGSEEDYCAGQWRRVNPISPQLAKKLNKYGVPERVIKEMGAR